jgi:DNA-binding CsgD family transcriptional regulator
MTPRVGPDISHDLESHRGMEPLSPREVSVLRLVASGKHNRSIGAHNRSHAVALAMKRGFLDH